MLRGVLTGSLTPVFPGGMVQFESKQFEVAGNQPGRLVLRDSSAANAAVAEPITQEALSQRYETVKLKIDGQDQRRYIERGHPERGYYQVSRVAGEILIAPDSSLRTIEIGSGTKISISPAQAAAAGTVRPSGTVTVMEPAAVSRPAPELPAPPTASNLTRAEIRVASDGTIRLETTGAGITLESLERQRELDRSHIGLIDAEARRLKQSISPEERLRGEQLELTVRALKGELGRDVQARANRGILNNLKEQLHRNARPSGGTMISIGILVSAGVAFYLSEMPPSPEPPIRRATVGR